MLLLVALTASFTVATTAKDEFKVNIASFNMNMKVPWFSILKFSWKGDDCRCNFKHQTTYDDHPCTLAGKHLKVEECEKVKLLESRWLAQLLVPQDKLDSDLFLFALQEAPIEKEAAFMLEIFKERIFGIAHTNLDIVPSAKSEQGLTSTKKLGKLAPLAVNTFGYQLVYERTVPSDPPPPTLTPSLFVAYLKKDATKRWDFLEISSRVVKIMHDSGAYGGKATFALELRVVSKLKPDEMREADPKEKPKEKRILLIGSHLTAGFNIYYEASKFVPQRLCEMYTVTKMFAKDSSETLSEIVKRYDFFTIFGDLNFRILPSPKDDKICAYAQGKSRACPTKKGVKMAKDWSSFFGITHGCSDCMKQVRETLLDEINDLGATEIFMKRDSLYQLLHSEDRNTIFTIVPPETCAVQVAKPEANAFLNSLDLPSMFSILPTFSRGTYHAFRCCLSSCVIYPS